ncbi:hypothetical protein V2595_09765 [Tenacibaculum maritimum]|uniref:Lipoprotein n=2 Tax=Tenacibaculum maritimum TaxID=107401 RepID=A0A2H1ED98_9FLAO|nr:hypothetical protein [Tenacibaculum maritimum]SFZ85017.1 conserved protein of unknown function [Tenacibaculum maritimum NCIMB 2154]
MKTMLYIVLVVSTICSCNSQHKKKRYKMMESFDIEVFDKNKNAMNEYIYQLNDDTVVKQQELSECYYSFLKEKKNLFEYVYEYRKDGVLKSSFRSFPNDFIAGILREYDEKGILVKEEDLEKPFVYSWEDIQNYLFNHKVENIQEQVVRISRWSDEEATTWTLDFYGEYDDVKGRFVVLLNGITGEELEVKMFKGKGVVGKTGTKAVYDILYKK